MEVLWVKALQKTLDSGFKTSPVAGILMQSGPGFNTSVLKNPAGVGRHCLRFVCGFCETPRRV